MTFWESVKSLFDGTKRSLVLFGSVLIVGSIIAVVIGDRYGSFYLGLIGIVILPFLAIRILPTGRRDKPRR
jgi:hypothetical protein